MKSALRFLLCAWLVFCVPLAWSAYACNVTATGNVGVLYTSSANTDDTGTVTLSCTRLTSDANSLTYRLYIDDGLNASGTQRRGKRIATPAKYINYAIYSNAARTTQWHAPATGTTNVVTGTLSFGSSTNASVSRTFYLRVPSGQNSVSSALYFDTMQASGRYPNSNSGTLTSFAPIDMSIGVGSQCVFRTTPAGITLNYTSFSSSAQTATTDFSVRCTNSLAYTLSVSPSSGTLLGLNYTVSLDATNATGTGSDQSRTITVTIAAGQSGTCATGSCSASQTHTVSVSY